MVGLWNTVFHSKTRRWAGSALCATWAAQMRCHAIAGTAAVWGLRQKKNLTAAGIAKNLQSDHIGSGSSIDQKSNSTNFQRMIRSRFPAGDLDRADQLRVFNPAFVTASFTAEHRLQARASRHRRLRLVPIHRWLTHDPGAGKVLSAEPMCQASSSASPTHRRNHLS